VKKILALLIALLAIMAVAAPASATPAYSQKDRIFVRLVRADAPVFKYAPASSLIKLGHSICGALDTGTDESEAVYIGMEAGMSQHQSLVVVASALTVYCPWHSDDIRGK
jgi:hypothetical protein